MILNNNRYHVGEYVAWIAGAELHGLPPHEPVSAD
jgi:hypothetical protein